MVEEAAVSKEIIAALIGAVAALRLDSFPF
jgi:hypothetical protein